MVLSTLSLRIYGGSLSTGFNTQALVSAGAAPEGFRPTPPTIVDEQRSWMITHAQAYTAYSLYHRSYPAADGKPGQMLLVLFLPPQLRLAEGKSPLALLDTLHDLFVVQAMADDRLPAEPIDSSAFQNLLRRYKLEERPTLLPIMTGSEPASFCADNITQIEALMRYSRYTELSNVGRLEVGLRCPTTIQIPIKGKVVQPRKDVSQQVQQKPTRQEEKTEQPKPEKTQQEQTPKEKVEVSQEEKQKQTNSAVPPIEDSVANESEQDEKNEQSLKKWLLIILIGVAGVVLYQYFSNSNDEEQLTVAEIIIQKNEPEPSTVVDPNSVMEQVPEAKKEEKGPQVIDSKNDYTKYDNGTIIDHQHHLMWMTQDYMVIEGRALPNASWFKAKEWCEKMNQQQFAGYSDWRMPSVAELKTLCTNKTQRSFYKSFFEHKNADYFWTNRSISNDVKSYVDLNDGFATSGAAIGQHNYSTGELFKFSVRLVRDIENTVTSPTPTKEEAETKVKEDAAKARAEEKKAEKKWQEAQNKINVQTAKAEILKMVKNGSSLYTIKKSPAYTKLSYSEIMDVEWYVDFYNMIEKTFKIRKRKNRLKSLIYPNGINSWDDLHNGRMRINDTVKRFLDEY